MGRYEFEHTKTWSDAVDDFDGFVFVTPEYNRAPSGVLKNALDYLYAEWNDKAAGIVSYGAAASGLRAAEALRLVLGERQIAAVRQSVGISLIHDFENFQTFVPGPQHAQHLGVQLDQLVAWAGAFRAVRLSSMSCRITARAISRASKPSSSRCSGGWTRLSGRRSTRAPSGWRGCSKTRGASSSPSASSTG